MINFIDKQSLRNKFMGDLAHKPTKEEEISTKYRNSMIYEQIQIYRQHIEMMKDHANIPQLRKNPFK